MTSYVDEDSGACPCTLTLEWLLTQPPTVFSFGPEKVWVKWMDCLVAWTGWITGLKSIAQCSFVRWLKVEYSVRWYQVWCLVSLLNIIFTSIRWPWLLNSVSLWGRELICWKIEPWFKIWLTETSCSLIKRSAELSALLREILGVTVACAECEPTVSLQHKYISLFARLQ